MKRSLPCIKTKSGITQRIIISTVKEDAYYKTVDSPELLYDYWKVVIEKASCHEFDKETLVCVLLNAKLKPFAYNKISVGTVTETLAHPREIIRPVICTGAFGFALMHNHPSGDPRPSRADSQLTTRIREASEMLQIRFIDHVIVGEPENGRLPYFSFKEAGHI